jgi:hypothetical protein
VEDYVSPYADGTFNPHVILARIIIGARHLHLRLPPPLFSFSLSRILVP